MVRPPALTLEKIGLGNLKLGTTFEFDHRTRGGRERYHKLLVTQISRDVVFKTHIEVFRDYFIHACSAQQSGRHSKTYVCCELLWDGYVCKVCKMRIDRELMQR